MPTRVLFAWVRMSTGLLGTAEILGRCGMLGSENDHLKLLKKTLKLPEDRTCYSAKTSFASGLCSTDELYSYI